MKHAHSHRRALKLQTLIFGLFLWCFGFGRIKHAYALLVPYDSSILTEDCSQPLQGHPYIQAVSGLSSDGGSWIPTYDPTTLPAYRTGIVSLHHFDQDNDCSTPDSSTTINRGKDALCGSIRPSLLFPPISLFNTSLFVNGTSFSFFFDPYPNPEQPFYGMTQAVWIYNSTRYNGIITEKNWNEFDIELHPTNRVFCRLRTSNEFFSVSGQFTTRGPFNQSAWNHVACSYSYCDNGTLSVFFNGQKVANKSGIFVDRFRNPGGRIGIGNRPYYSNSNGFVGFLDDLVFYEQSLSEKQIKELYDDGRNGNPIIPSEGIRAISHVLVFNGSEHQIWDIIANWSFHSADVSNVSGTIASNSASKSCQKSPENLLVEISTDQGITWCQLSLNTPLNYTQSICHFPSIHFQYRITFLNYVALDKFSFKFGFLSPLETLGKKFISFPMGMNLGGIVYYGSWQPLANVFLQSSTVDTSPNFRNYDMEGYPLSLNSTINGETVSYLLFRGSGYDKGIFRVELKGKGRISYQFDARGVLVAPGVYNITINTATSSGIQFNILESNPLDPVRDIKVWYPGYYNLSREIPQRPPHRNHPVPPEYHDPVMDGTQEFFRRDHIQLLKDGKFSVLRFMDWQKTGSFVANWTDRNTPSSIQHRQLVREWNISSIVLHSPTAFSENNVVQVTTTTPHNLVTGQYVTFSGTDGSFLINDAGTFRLFLHNQIQEMVEVINSTCFLIKYTYWAWPGSFTLENFTASTQGQVKAVINLPTSIEYAIDLSNRLLTDFWICIPHLANDDYIREMAILIYHRLDPVLNVYIEYSNEVWNWAFMQTKYVMRMAKQQNVTRAEFITKRSVEIFYIFHQVFKNDSRVQNYTIQSNPTNRLQRILPGHVAGASFNDELLKALSNPRVNPYDISVDILAIAPYFGGSVANDIADQKIEWNVTVDDVLDLARSSIYSSVYFWIKDNQKVARRYGVRLIAYEGGQHLVGTSGVENNVRIESLLKEANSHPRMKGLYDLLFLMWSELTKVELAPGIYQTSEFVPLTWMGSWSKWGSWSMLISPKDNQNMTFKYQSVKKISFLSEANRTMELTVRDNLIAQACNNGNDTSHMIISQQDHSFGFSLHYNFSLLILTFILTFWVVVIP